MHVRCPQCHNRVEVVDDTSLAEINCPSCGSSFSLIGGDTTEEHRAEPRRLAQFELIRELGVGRFGSVWMACDTQLDRTVAVKIPRKGALSAKEAELFLRDARATAQLKHPNIVGVHEVGREDDTVFIVTDYIEGANLKEWLSGQRLTFRESAELIVKLAEALHHAHQAGVVHRDLKPGNVMLDHGGQPYVIDFGLARRDAGEITMTMDGHVLGTPAYMSPEQAKGHGHEADRRSDVYSLGVILFELLTGELPFRGDTQMLLLQIQRDEPPRPRRLNGRVPRDLETITLKCLQKEPGRRYQTAQDLAADLRHWLDGVPIVARPVGRLERGWQWCKRNPVVSALTVTVPLVALMGFIGIGWQWRHAVHARDAESQAHAVADRERLSAQSAARSEAVARREAEQAREAESQQKSQALDAKAQALKAQQQEESARKQAEDRESVARRKLYMANMIMAHQAWQRADLVRVNELLDLETPPPGAEDIRGFEYYLLARLARASLRTFDRHTGLVKAFAFFPDGRKLVSGAWDGKLYFWDVASGRVERELTVDDYITTVAVTSDGTKLAVAGMRGPVKVLDVATNTWIHELRGHARYVSGLAFAASGDKLYSASAANEDNTVRCWDLAGGKEMWARSHTKWENVPSNGVVSLAVSPDGKTLISGGGPYFGPGEVYLWDATSGELRRKLSPHEAIVPALAFSPDAAHYATGSADGTIKIWDTSTMSEEGTLLSNESPVVTLCFAPDNVTLASGSLDRTVRVWDIGLRKLMATHKVHTESVGCVRFSPNGDLLASCADTSLKLYPASAPNDYDALSSADASAAPKTSNAEGASPPLNGVTLSLAFTPDQNLLAVGRTTSLDKGQVELWDFPHKSRRMTLTQPDGKLQPVWCIAFSPDGANCAAGSGLLPLSSQPKLSTGAVSIWDTKDGTLLSKFNPHALAVMFVGYSEDGKQLLTVGMDGGASRWDPATRRLIKRFRKPSGVTMAAARSSDRSVLAIADFDKIELWDLRSDAICGQLSTQGQRVMSLAFTSDGRTLAAGTGDFNSPGNPGSPHIWLWNLQSRQATVLPRHTMFVRGLAFSPDNRRLASVSFTGEVRLWDVEFGNELLSYAGHSMFAMCAAFSPDGNVLAVGTDRGQTKLWEVAAPSDK